MLLLNWTAIGSRMRTYGPALLTALLLGGAGPTFAQEAEEPLDLVALAERYCVVPDGDHRLTWTLAERDGFSWLSEDNFPGLRLPSAIGENLRGLSNLVDGREVRVLTSAFSWVAPGDGQTYFRQCWVSASDYDLGRARLDLRSALGVPGFTSKQVHIYAWVPRADGSNRVVSRRDYRRRHLTMAREEGLRQVSLRQHGRAVFIGYTSPRDRATYEQFDWAGPEPVPAPQ